MRLNRSSGHWSSLSSGSFAETIASLRSCASSIFFRRRIHFVQRHIVRYGVERGDVRQIGEAIKHRCRRRVHLVHRRQTQNQFNRAEQTRLVVLRVDDRAAFRERADDISRRAIAADVVPTVLRIVLDGENAGVRPKFAVAHCVNNLSERQIVVSHLRFRSRRIEFCRARVIVRQPDDRQARQKLSAASNFFRSLINCDARKRSGTSKSQPTVFVTM